MNVRDATFDDVPAMVGLGRELHSESVYAEYDFDERKVAQLIEMLIGLHAGIAVVAEEDHEIHGGILGSVYPHWFGSDLQSTDYALFVSKEHRGNRTAVQLVDEYVKQASFKGAKQVLLSSSTGIKPEVANKLYESCGFKNVGNVAVHVP